MSTIAVHVRAVLYHHLALEDVDPAPRDVSCALGHELDGCLELSGDPSSVFVSWQRPEQPDGDFHIEVFQQNPNRGAAFTEDYSDDPMWADVVGRQIRLTYLDTTRFVLQIGSDEGRVFACAHEDGEWGFDTVTVCKSLPAAGDGIVQPIWRTEK